MEYENMGNQFRSVLDKTIIPETIDGKDCLKELSKIIIDETGIDEDEALKIVELISKTIDRADESFKDLQRHKKNGGTATEWLHEKLEEIDKRFPSEQDDITAKQLLDNLIKANKEIADELCDQYGIEKKPSALDTETLGEYIGLNKKRYIDAIKDESVNNSLYDILNFQRGKLKISKEDKENPLIKRYFEDELDCAGDKQIKKAVSTAAVIAREKQILPENVLHKTDDEMALIVDKGLTAAKVAYKVANGDLNPLDAVEYTIDRNVSIINTAVAIKSTTIGGKAGAWLGGAVGSIFGPGGSTVGAAIGNVVGKAAGYLVGGVIGEGVRKIGGAIKEVAVNAWEGVKSLASSVKDAIADSPLNPFNWF